LREFTGVADPGYSKIVDHAPRAGAARSVSPWQFVAAQQLHEETLPPIQKESPPEKDFSDGLS